MHRRTFVAGVASFVSAGCLRLTGAGTPTGGSSPTPPPERTPSPTEATSGGRESAQTTRQPDTNTTASSIEYPLGLEPDGPNPILAEVHRNYLLQQSFEVRYRLANVSDGHLMEDFTQRASDAYRVEVNHGRQNDLIRFSTSTEDLWWRQLVDGGETFGYNHWAASKEFYSHWWELEAYLAAGDFDAPEVVDRDGGREFAISADGTTDESVLSRLPFFGGGSVETFEAGGRVTPDGLIRTMGVTMQWIDGEGSLREIRSSFQVTDTDVSVTAPTWLSAAKERAPTVSVNLTNDERVVAVRHEGGNPIVPTAQFAFRGPTADHTEDIVHAERITEAFDPGETAYVYLDGGEMAVAFGDLPGSATPEALSDDYSVFAEVGSAPYFPPVPLA